MPVLTDADLEREKQAAGKKHRSALQARLKDRANLVAARDRALEELAMAQALVSRGERTRVYLKPFEAAVESALKALGELDNSIPLELQNNCQDQNLLDEYATRSELRRQAIREVQASRESFNRESANRELLIGNISQQRGKPARLQAGSELPWSTSLVGRIVGAFVGDHATTWAIDSENNIAFHPSVVRQDVEHYSSQWRDTQRSLRMAKLSLDAVELRLAEAESAFADVKAKMINSP